MSEAEIYFFKTTPPSAPLHPPTRSFRQLTDTTVNVKQRDSCEAIVLRYSQIFHELLFLWELFPNYVFKFQSSLHQIRSRDAMCEDKESG